MLTKSAARKCGRTRNSIQESASPKPCGRAARKSGNRVSPPSQRVKFHLPLRVDHSSRSIHVNGLCREGIECSAACDIPQGRSHKDGECSGGLSKARRPRRGGLKPAFQKTPAQRHTSSRSGVCGVKQMELVCGVLAAPPDSWRVAACWAKQTRRAGCATLVLRLGPYHIA